MSELSRFSNRHSLSLVMVRRSLLLLIYTTSPPELDKRLVLEMCRDKYHRDLVEHFLEKYEFIKRQAHEIRAAGA